MVHMAMMIVMARIVCIKVTTMATLVVMVMMELMLLILFLLDTPFFYPGRYPAPQACQQRLCKRPLLFIMVCSGLADDRKNPAQKCTAVVCTVSAPLRSEFKARGMAQYFQSKVQAERTSAGERHSQGFTRASCNRTQRSWPDSRHQESKRCQASFDHLNFMSFRRFPASHARHWPLVESV